MKIFVTKFLAKFLSKLIFFLIFLQLEKIKSNLLCSLICLKTKSATYCLTELFPIHQNKHWIIRRRDDHTIVPLSHCIILKIVGFLGLISKWSYIVCNHFSSWFGDFKTKSLFLESSGTSTKEALLGHTFLSRVLTPTATHGLLNFFHFVCVCNMV